jgi:hypothetical protein
MKLLSVGALNSAVGTANSAVAMSNSAIGTPSSAAGVAADEPSSGIAAIVVTSALSLFYAVWFSVTGTNTPLPKQ